MTVLVFLGTELELAGDIDTSSLQTYLFDMN